MGGVALTGIGRPILGVFGWEGPRWDGPVPRVGSGAEEARRDAEFMAANRRYQVAAAGTGALAVVAVGAGVYVAVRKLARS